MYSMKLHDKLQEAQERRRKARHGDSHENKTVTEKGLFKPKTPAEHYQARNLSQKWFSFIVI